MKEKLRISSGLDGAVWSHRFQRDARRASHRHDELEFNLITRGRASYLLGDRRVDLTQGVLIWLFPAVEHLLLHESDDFAMWIVVVRPMALRRGCATPDIAALCQPSPPPRDCLRLVEADYRDLDDLATRVRAVDDDPDAFNAGLGWLLHSAWRATQRGKTAGDTAALHPAVERAATILRDNDPTLRLDELARRSGLSASRLSRLFGRQVGLSVTEYRNRVRVDRFITLYANGRRRTMLDAALQAGFGSYIQFHRAFKRHMGCGPAAYRRRISTAATDNRQ